MEINDNDNDNSTRRCQNCVFWKTDKTTKTGQCTQRPYFFAYTLIPNLYMFTKHFYLCDSHRFADEDKIDVVVSEQVHIANINEIDTYFNRSGFPILRKCQNCTYWRSNKINNLGQCSFQSFYFAFSNDLDNSKNLYGLTKEFFLCENHKLFNEDKMKNVSEKVKLKDIIKRKDVV